MVSAFVPEFGILDTVLMCTVLYLMFGSMKVIYAVTIYRVMIRLVLVSLVRSYGLCCGPWNEQTLNGQEIGKPHLKLSEQA